MQCYYSFFSLWGSGNEQKSCEVCLNPISKSIFLLLSSSLIFTLIVDHPALISAGELVQLRRWGRLQLSPGNSWFLADSMLYRNYKSPKTEAIHGVWVVTITKYRWFLMWENPENWLVSSFSYISLKKYKNWMIPDHIYHRPTTFLVFWSFLGFELRRFQTYLSLNLTTELPYAFPFRVGAAFSGRPSRKPFNKWIYAFHTRAHSNFSLIEPFQESNM